MARTLAITGTAGGVVATTPTLPATQTGTIPGGGTPGGTGSFAVNAGTGATATAGGTLAPGATTILVFGVRIDQ